MSQFTAKALDVGAGALYAFATAIDVCADWLAHRHRPRY